MENPSPQELDPIKYLKLLDLENHLGNHQQNHYRLLPQPNPQGISPFKLPHHPKNLLANRSDLHKNAPRTKDAFFLLKYFPSSYIYHLISESRIDLDDADKRKFENEHRYV
jgi:hypothetical protein